MATHPEDLPADVGDPLLLQGVALGVLDQVGDRAGTAELHDQLRTHMDSYRQLWGREAVSTRICLKTNL